MNLPETHWAACVYLALGIEVKILFSTLRLVIEKDCSEWPDRREAYIHIFLYFKGVIQLSEMNLKDNDEKIVFEKLSKQLAYNYYSSSLTKDASIKNSSDRQAEVIFKDKALADTPWCRNILIVGSGISYSAYDFIKLTKELIELVEQKLGFTGDEHLIKKLKKKYIRLGELYQKQHFGAIDSSHVFKKVQDKILFEGRMSMLAHFFNKEDIIEELEKQLDHKYLPSTFYEMAAHLFKHRFIDVIINFNFDELLDNAIEDELGEGTYHAVVSDRDFTSPSHLLDRDHLIKRPIYIKPHGTISSKSSLLFTKEQYIDMSEKIKTLIRSLLLAQSHNGTNSEIKHFNLIVAGFNMDSIELNDILQQQTQAVNNGSLDAVNYFILNPANITQNIKNNIQWEEKNKENITFLQFEKEDEGEYNPAFYLKRIYTEIQNHFNHPFTPPNPYRHEMLNFLFPEGEIKTVFQSKGREQFLLDHCLERTKFHILYEALKFKGKISLSAISYDRAGKYFRLYLDKLKANKQDMELSLLGLAIELLKLKSDTESDSLYSTELALEKLKTHIHESLLENSKEYVEANDINREELDRLIENVYGKGANEISAKVKDTKLGRLNWVSDDQFLTTNLALTYKFYDFAVNKFNEWDTMLCVDTLGKAVFNLHNYCDKKNSIDDHLYKVFKAGKKIKMLVANKKYAKRIENIYKAAKKFKYDSPSTSNVRKGNLKIREFGKMHQNHHLHYMYLFLYGETLKFGIYHFKSLNKNRINPIFFDATTNDNLKNDLANLKILKDLFDKQMSNL